jgi:hypothetical protein
MPGDDADFLGVLEMGRFLRLNNTLLPNCGTIYHLRDIVALAARNSDSLAFPL